MTTFVSLLFITMIPNMGTNDLPDMYAKSPRAHEGFGHAYQANHWYPCYNYCVTLPVRLIALIPIEV